MKEEVVDREAVANKKKRLLTIFGAILSILLLILLVYYVNCVKPVKDFETYYEQQQYEQAYDLYSNTLTRIRSNARKAEQTVREWTDFWWLKYVSASITREEIEKVLASADMYENLSDYTDDMNAAAEVLFASRALYDSGLAHMEAGEWQAAIADFEQMQKDDTLYKDGIQKAQEAADGYCEQIISEALALAEENKYEDAILLIDDNLKLYPDYAGFKEQKELIYKAYKEYQKNTSLAEAQNYLEEENLEEAVKILGTLRKEYPDDDAISAVFAQYEDSYSAKILEEAQPLYEEGLYAEALEILAPAYAVLPKHEAIAELYDQTAGHLPAWLNEFSCENISLRGTRKAEKSTTDVQGNTYEHSIVYTEPSALSMQTMTYAEGKESYTLNGAYTRLFGTLAIKDGSRGIRNDQTGTFRIYGDDEVLLEVDGLSEESEPVPFDVDITGVDTLSFTFESGIGLKYVLGEVCVYKTYPEAAE